MYCLGYGNTSSKNTMRAELIEAAVRIVHDCA